MQRDILVAMADSHAGNNQALLNPETVLERDDESGEQHSYNPLLTPWQELVFANYRHQIDEVMKLAGRDRITLLHVGDLTQGKTYEENWVSSRLSDQILIAYYNLLPWMQYDNIETIRLAKGTGVHVFKEGSSEILVSKLLQKDSPKKNIACVYHGLLTLNSSKRSFRVDYAHHGPPPGSRDWLKGNVAQLYLRDIMRRSLKRGILPPDLVLRAHFHEYSRAQQIEQWGNNVEYISTIITLPSFCGGSDAGVRLSRSRDSLDIGLCAFEIVDGKLLEVHKFFETYDIRTQENIDNDETIG